ncbi:MAG: molybdopterin guanine dinucleotide-containing S/N-oxide reductase [Burkholderiaceae bacterium]
MNAVDGPRDAATATASSMAAGGRLEAGTELTSSHWGVYEVVRDAGGARGLRAVAGDPDPSPIGLAMWDAYRSPLRVRRPAVRAGWLERAPGDPARGAGRGREPFVEVSWERALDLVSGELRRVIDAHGNASVFGGSYGWSSAGRFHHAQSQVHRFLNVLGGYVRHADSYSLGAGRVLMPHVVASIDWLITHHHSWEVLAEHTRLFVSFGGVPAKNAQISAGGVSEHRARAGLAAIARAGGRFVNFSPVRDDLDAPAGSVEWIPIRPNTDTAAMLALATETILAGRHDEAFLRRHCTGFERWRAYLLGEVDGVVRDARWAEPITEVPAAKLREVAARMAATRTMVNVAWSLQRSDHGEQAFWAAVGLASVLGQVGLPGGGFGVGYGPVNNVGGRHELVPGPALPQGRNGVAAFIPVARIADMLLAPGGEFTYNGARHRYPDIRLVYWAGGNPFHHHQDLNRLARAWTRPETVVVHEQVWNAHAKHADIVLPATSTLERDDIGYAHRDPLLVAMKRVAPPPGEARDDYDIFGALATRLGRGPEFTEGRSTRAWLEHLYGQTERALAERGTPLPGFERFWADGHARLPLPDAPVVMFAQFRADPVANALSTPSGRIELYSERIASFGLADCPGHPAWLEPAEWLGSPLARRHPLHLISDQPYTKLHSQLDHSGYSRANKVAGREPVTLHPDDAAARGIRDGDVVRVFNDRGACLAGARVSDGVRPGVAKLSTGAWWDPDPSGPAAPDRHGNPNVLTRDVGASGLSQGCSAQTCLVEVERFDGTPPAVTAFDLPAFVPATPPNGTTR